jgi:hypothetical protein
MIQAVAMNHDVAGAENGKQRKAVRYRLTSPVSLRVCGRDEISRQFCGEATNISGRGIYIVTDSPLTPGTPLDITITFPQERASGDLLVACARARVLRSDEVWQGGQHLVGIAAEIEYFRL